MFLSRDTAAFAVALRNAGAKIVANEALFSAPQRRGCGGGDNMRVIIIGGVAGGATAAAAISRISRDTETVIFEKGAYISFAA